MTRLFLALALFLTATAAQAATFTGTAVGNWTNPQGTTGFGIANLDTGDATFDQSYLFWGQTANCPACTSFNNFWAFDGVGSDGDAPWNTQTEQLFKFGDLSYRNGSVYGHDFTGADLSISLQILSPLNTVETFNFTLEVENVPNTSGDPVTDGDIAKIVGGVADQTFVYNGETYTLQLMGFSRDGGATLANQFQVAEGTTDGVALYGRITVVPVPASVSLLGLALLMLGLGFRRKARLA